MFLDYHRAFEEPYRGVQELELCPTPHNLQMAKLKGQMGMRQLCRTRQPGALCSLVICFMLEIKGGT